MEYTRSVAKPELHHHRQADQSYILVDTVVIDRSFPHAPAAVYQLNESASADSSSFNKDSLTLLGSLSGLCRKKKHIYLADHKVVSYTHLVIVSCNSQGSVSARSLDHLSHGAYRTIRHALRCSDIRNGTIPEIAQSTCAYSSNRYSAKLTHRPMLLLGAVSLFADNRRKEMEGSIPNASQVLGLHSGSNRLYQVHT